MHVVESSNLIWQVIFGEILSESPIELFVALSSVDEGLSKVLATHFDPCIPLVAGFATSIARLIERFVRCASHHLVKERCGSTPTVDVGGFASISDSGISLRHNCGMAFVQEYVFCSLTSHGARHNSEYRWFELGVFRFHWIVLVRPKSIGRFHSERTQVLELIDGLNFMVVLRHVLGLPQRFWLRHSIVTGRWCPPPLCGVVRIILLVVGPGVG